MPGLCSQLDLLYRVAHATLYSAYVPADGVTARRDAASRLCRLLECIPAASSPLVPAGCLHVKGLCPT